MKQQDNKQCKKFIALYRVSTQKQGVSGLGLEAQRTSVREYISSIGGSLLEEFTEVESGGNKDRISFNKNYTIEGLIAKRPVLRQALEQAKNNNACIIVKEASRLTRFPLLMEYIIAQHIQFVAADNPNDSTTILRLRTALSAEELYKVSERTYNALQVIKKASGGKMIKKDNTTNEGRLKGIRTIKEKARLANLQAKDKINDLYTRMKDGKRVYPTLQSIADKMNELGYTTSRGKMFTPKQVQRLLE